MLGKLIKHEFIDTWKLFLLLDVAILIIGAFIGLSVSTSAFSSSDASGFFTTMGLGLYTLILPCLGTICLVFIVVHYYRSLYSSQGYLTFTLPATTSEILFSRMLVAYIFEIINILCIILSIVFVVMGFYSVGESASGNLFTHMVDNMIEDFYETPIEVIVTNVLWGISRIIYFLTTVFFAISLGQLWQKHRIIGAIVSYFGIKIVSAIISTIFKVVNSNDLQDTVEMYHLDEYNTDSALVMAAFIATVICLLMSAAMYFGSVLITKHKLNLE